MDDEGKREEDHCIPNDLVKGKINRNDIWLCDEGRVAAKTEETLVCSVIIDDMSQDQPHVIQRSVEDGSLAVMLWENEKVSCGLIA